MHVEIRFSVFLKGYVNNTYIQLLNTLYLVHSSNMLKGSTKNPECIASHGKKS